MNNRIVVKNTLFYTIGSIIPRISSFILLPIYTKFLLPSDYGIVQSMRVLITVLSVLFTLATERSIFRLYFDYNDDKQKKELIGNITILIVSISIILVLLLFSFKSYTQLIFKSIPFYPYYSYAIITANLLAFETVPLNLLMVRKKAGYFIALSLTKFFLITISVIYFIVIKNQGAEGMLKGEMLGNLILIPVFLYLLIKESSFNINLQKIYNALTFSLPMVPTLISSWILNMSDRIFIEKYFNLEDVGIYSLGYKIASLVLLISGSINKAYNPIFYEMANNQPNAKIILKRYNTLIITIIFYTCFTIALLSKELIVLFIDSKYINAYKIIPLITLAYLIHLSAGLMNLMIYQNKKSTYIMIVVLLSAVINIFLNFILIPNYGIIGAAWATILSVFVMFIIEYYFARKCYFIPFDWGKLIPSLVFLTMIFILEGSLIKYCNFTSLIIKIITIMFLGIILFYRNLYQFKPLLSSNKTVQK